MTAALATQCTARAKSTGERCRQPVIGGGVCRFHGGKAPQVAAAREVRARALRSKAYGATEERSPADALLAAAQALDATVQRLEGLAAEQDGADPPLLREIRAAAGESARVSKLILDAGLDARRQALAERDQLDVARVLELTLAAFGVDPGMPEVRRVVAVAVERVRDGDLRPLELVVPAVAAIEARPVELVGEVVAP